MIDNNWKKFNTLNLDDGNKYYFSIGKQFFIGHWSEKLKGFILLGTNGRYMCKTCDYFHKY